MFGYLVGLFVLLQWSLSTLLHNNDAYQLWVRGRKWRRNSFLVFVVQSTHLSSQEHATHTTTLNDLVRSAHASTILFYDTAFSLLLQSPSVVDLTLNE